MGPTAMSGRQRISANGSRWRSRAKRAKLQHVRRRASGKASVQTAVAAALAALLSLATGCMVGPNYRRPPAAAPGAFKEPPPADWQMAQPRDQIQRGKWWEIFGDPQLGALEEQVAVANQSVAQAEAQFRAARAAAGIARGGLFPTVTAGASATKSRARSGGTTLVTGGTGGTGSIGGTGGTATTAGTGATVTTFQVPVDVSWEIDVWGRVRRLIEADVATAQASAADLENLRLSLQAELAVDWFQLHGLDAQKQLLDATAGAYQTALKVTSNRHDQGIASGVDVAQAETQLETTRAQSIDLGVQRTALEHAIALLTGRSPAELTIPVAPIGVAPPPIPVALPGELVERRPDVAAAERRAAAANAQIGVQEAAYFPTISLTGSGGFASSRLASLFSWPSRFWALGASAVETIFNGGARHAATTQAKATFDAAAAGYRQSVLVAFQEVEDNLSALRVLADEATQEAAAVAAAERSLALANNRYRGGITTYLEVITAQNAALANERTAVDVLTRRMTASVNLVKALGGGWRAADLPGGAAILARASSSQPEPALAPAPGPSPPPTPPPVAPVTPLATAPAPPVTPLATAPAAPTPGAPPPPPPSPPSRPGRRPS
jgi:NodT family efflux transporter outer membrane factor (OMF) lipoprotein